MTDSDYSPRSTVADCHAILDAHGIPVGRLGQRVRWVLVERARLQRIEAAALDFKAAIAACDGIQAAEAALLAALNTEKEGTNDH